MHTQRSTARCPPAVPSSEGGMQAHEGWDRFQTSHHSTCRAV
jgi:hypothetical protein